MGPEALKGHLEGLILAILAEGPLHGYAIIEALRQRSHGAFDLPEGTIYPALHRLELDGSLESDWVVANGRRRRVYRLTGSGRNVLRVQIEQWREFARGVQAVLSPNGMAAST